MTTPSFVNATAANGTSTGTGAISVPSGTVDNDLLLLIISINTITPTITGGLTGWTLGSGPDNSPSGGGPANRSYWYWKVAASEPSSYTPTASASSTRRYVMTTWRDAHATTPIEAASTPQGYAGTSVTTNNVTAGGSDRLLVLMVNAEISGSVAMWNAISGMTLHHNATAGGQGVGIYSEGVGAGTYNRTATHNQAATDGMSYLLSIAPAVVGGGSMSTSLSAPLWFG